LAIACLRKHERDREPGHGKLGPVDHVDVHVLQPVIPGNETLPPHNFSGKRRVIGVPNIQKTLVSDLHLPYVVRTFRFVGELPVSGSFDAISPGTVQLHTK
jgi:hypothetical protein